MSIDYTQLEMRLAAEYAEALKKVPFGLLRNTLADKLFKK